MTEANVVVLRRVDSEHGPQKVRVLRTYLAKKAADKSALLALEAEERRTEVLIGELLGPAVNGGDRRSPDRPVTTLVTEIAAPDRNRFRALASHADLVERLLAEGVTKRKPILDRIKEHEQEAEALATATESTGRTLDNSQAATRLREARIREMAAAGHSAAHIAETLGYSGTETLRATAKKIGVSFPADQFMAKRPRIDSNKVIEALAGELDAATTGLDLINGADVDPEVFAEAKTTIDEAIKTIRAALKRVEKEMPA